MNYNDKSIKENMNKNYYSNFRNKKRILKRNMYLNIWYKRYKKWRSTSRIWIRLKTSENKFLIKEKIMGKLSKKNYFKKLK